MLITVLIEYYKLMMITDLIDCNDYTHQKVMLIKYYKSITRHVRKIVKSEY